MIVNGRTLAQVQEAAWSVMSCTVKLKAIGPLKLSGYIAITTTGGAYRTKDQNGAMHPWQPCYHFYQHLMKALYAQKESNGETLPYPTITLHKFLLKLYNAASKANYALKKKGLVCAHDTIVTPSIAAPGITPITPPPVSLPKGEPMTFPMLVGSPVEPGQTSNVQEVKGKVRPIYAVCTSLYVLEYCKAGAQRIPAHLGAEIPDHLLMRAAHAVQWRNRVTRYAEHFAHTFARNLFDYLTMASFGEARYSQGKSFTFDCGQLVQNGPRVTAYQGALRYDPRDLLPKLEHVFNNYHWASTLGGKKWGKIAKFAGEFFKPMYRDYPVVFADHCVDLAHNGGLAFNKGYILGNPSSESAYMAMLDSKKTDTFMSQTAYQHPITPAVYAFWAEGVSLGLVPPSKAGFKVVEDVDVPTLTWGTEHVALYAGHHNTTTTDVVSAVSPTIIPTEATIEQYPDRT